MQEINTIIDSNTGAIISESESQYKYPGFIKFKENCKFTKTYHTEIVEFKNKSYYKYFYYCQQYLEIGTNRIAERSKDLFNGKSLTAIDLSKKCNTSASTIYPFFDYCMKHKIIRKLDVDNEFFGYFMNPIYTFNGSSIDPILYLLFKGYGIDKYISKSGKTTLNKYCSIFSPKQMLNHKFKK